MTRINHQLLFLGCLLIFTSQGIANENSKVVADELFNGTTLVFEYKGNFSNATISVSGPNGFYTSHFQMQGAPELELQTQTALADGLYKYQLTVATDKTIKVNNLVDNGRSTNEKTTMNIGASQSGHFRIQDGIIITNLASSEGG